MSNQVKKIRRRKERGIKYTSIKGGIGIDSMREQLEAMKATSGMDFRDKWDQAIKDFIKNNHAS